MVVEHDNAHGLNCHGEEKPSLAAASPTADLCSQQQSPPLLQAIGPAFATELSFWFGAVFVSGILQGIVLGFLALAFFVSFETLQVNTWNFGEYHQAVTAAASEDDDNVEAAIFSSLKLGNGRWWYVGLLTATGAAVGLCKALWTWCISPRHAFPARPDGFLVDVQRLSSDDPFHAIPIFLCSILSIGGGASCGPEMALGATGVAMGGSLLPNLGRWFNSRWKTSNNQPANDIFGFEGREKLTAMDGIAGALGPLFPAQMISTLLMHEIGRPVSYHNSSSNRSQEEDGTTAIDIMETITRTGIASSVSYAVFVGLKDRTILDTVAAPEAAYDEISTIRVLYLLQAAVLGIISGVVGLIAFLCLAMGDKVGTVVNQKIDLFLVGTFCCGQYIEHEVQNHHSTHPKRTYLGMIITPTLGGCLLGLLAIGCPLTLGDGSVQLEVLLLHGEKLGVANLLVSALVKIVAASITSGFGFIGGQVFPLLFAGSSIGSAAHLLVPQVPLLIAYPACMVAIPCSFTPLMFTLTLTASLALALGGAATAPVFVAAICSFLMVSGCGFIQRIVSRAMTTAATRNNNNNNNDNNNLVS
jgi:H+/Cl- antiporter ClcA